MAWRLPAAAGRTWVFASRREKRARFFSLSLSLSSRLLSLSRHRITGNMRALERVLLRGFPSAAESPRWKQSEAASAAGKPGRVPSLLPRAACLPACCGGSFHSCSGFRQKERREGGPFFFLFPPLPPPVSSFHNTPLGFDASCRGKVFPVVFFKRQLIHREN